MTQSLSQRLADARRDHVSLDTLSPEQIPADASAAYAIQYEILSLNGAGMPMARVCRVKAMRL
jgi:2-keto-4-pentenoate hydratase